MTHLRLSPLRLRLRPAARRRHHNRPSPLSSLELWALALLLQSSTTSIQEIARVAGEADDWRVLPREALAAGRSLVSRGLCRWHAKDSLSLTTAGRVVALIEAARLVERLPRRSNVEVWRARAPQLHSHGAAQ